MIRARAGGASGNPPPTVLYHSKKGHVILLWMGAESPAELGEGGCGGTELDPPTEIDNMGSPLLPRPDHILVGLDLNRKPLGKLN